MTRSVQHLATAGLALAAVVTVLAIPVAGQPIAFGRVKHFMVPEYFDPPRENVLKSRLTGGEAEPQPGGSFLLREVKAETFREDGELDLVLAAPECVYESKARIIRSAGWLRAASGDGRLAMEGEGFLWQQATGKLIISNRVHTVIQQPPRNAAPKQP